MSSLLYALYADLRFALRGMRKAPGFAITAIVTLALGIGAATSVFSLVDTVLLRPLPFPQPDRLVALDTLERSGSAGAATLPTDTSYPGFFDWRSQARSFQSLASWQAQSFTLESSAPASSAPARRIDGMAVSSGFFETLGITPALGRSFTRPEEQAGNRSVIISHQLWQSVFGASPSALGKTIRLSDESLQVVGILPVGFHFPNAPDAEAWITPALAMEGTNPSGKQRGWHQLSVLGRLAPGTTIEQARAEMQTIQKALSVQYPEDDATATGVSVKPELQDLTGDIQQPLHILFSAVCFLLLIACANVAGLLLTRTAARRPELALRTALGATRLEITRQLLVESLTLSTLGGLLGFALATAALRLAPQVLPNDLPRLEELSLNASVFFFALGAALVTGLIFGVFPAWRSSRLDPALALRDQARGTTAGRGQNRLHAALVIGETALGLMLLVGAGLLIRSFDRILSVDPGFNPQHLVAFRVGMPAKRFRDQQLVQLSQQLQSRMASMHGVSQATYGFPLPLSGTNMTVTFKIAGHPTAPGEEPSARASVVASNFFSALQMPLRRGRFFTPAEDQPNRPPVIIVNQAFADRYFPGEDALGKHIQSDLAAVDDNGGEGKPLTREIVGIVQNATRATVTEPPQPEYYLPFAQAPVSPPVFALRVAGNPAAYVASIRSLVAQQDASLPVYAVRTNLLTRSTAQQKFQTLLLSGFALLALLLSAIGLYAVISYMVAQRTVELGLRLALGASRSDVLALVLKRGLTLSIAGVILGLGASVLLTRYVSTILFHTRALDALTFTGMTLLLLTVSIASCLLPAWRAALLNPNETLRQQ